MNDICFQIIFSYHILGYFMNIMVELPFQTVTQSLGAFFKNIMNRIIVELRKPVDLKRWSE
jgi:hypothetical protein